MIDVFERSAWVYDIVHASKDYAGEAALLARLLEPAKRLAGASGPRLIEFGCGTGEFSRHLADHGWNVLPGDISLALLDRARRKGLWPLFLADMRDGDVVPSGVFHASCCMFGAFSYVALTNEDLHKALRVVRSRLKTGGLFAFDVVQLTAAAANLYGERSQTFTAGGEIVQRYMRKSLCAETGVVTIDLRYTYRGESWDERHYMRAFSVPEIRAALERENFRCRNIVRTCDDPLDNTIEVSVNDYYVLFVGEAA